MRNIFFLRFGPTSKIIGNIINPWWFQKNGFNVHFWDISKFFYPEKLMQEFYSVSSKYQFEGPNHIIFKSKEELISQLYKIEENSIIMYGNRHPFISVKKDDWVYNSVLKKTKNIIPFQYDNLALPNKLFNNLKLYYHLYKNRFLSRKIKIRSFIGCGAVGRFYSKKIYPYSPFISVASPLVNWSKLEKIKNFKYNVFVDENVNFSPDAKLANIKFNNDPSGYYLRINNYLSKVENITGVKTIIAASGKFYYEQNPYLGREIIYGKTLQLIQHCSMVFGHGSSALYQAIIDKKPLMLIDDKSFTPEKRFMVIDYASRVTLKKVYNIEDVTAENIKNESFINYEKYHKSEVSYFRETGIKSDFKDIISEKINVL